MSTNKKVFPVLRISFVADNEKQYNVQINEFKRIMGMTLRGAYVLQVRISVIIEDGLTSLVAHKENEDRVIDVQFSSCDDHGDDEEEDYFFIGSKDDPDDELLIIASVHQQE